MRHIRDGANQYDYVHNIYYALYNRAGIKFTLSCVPFSDWPISSTLTRLKVHPEVLEGIEAPNEPDLFVWNYAGLSGYPVDKAYATNLYNALRADPVLISIPVIAFGMAGAALGIGTARVEMAQPRGLVLSPFFSSDGIGLQLSHGL